MKIIETDNIKTLKDFKKFCMQLKDNSYKDYDFYIKNNVISNIIENLEKEIDIENKLYEWEEIITLLYYHFIDDFIVHALHKLYTYYPNYPIECLFELVLNNEPWNYDCTAFWYRTMSKIYTTFYKDKIDSEVFDKYLLFAYNNGKYFIALLYKNNFNIPKNSLYIDIEVLLKKRFAYDAKIRHEAVDELLERYGLSMKNIKNINIDRFTDYSYTHATNSPLIWVDNGGDISFSHLGGEIAFADEDNTIYILEITFLKSAILETDTFIEAKKNNIILEEDQNFHNFLIYKWGIVKYFKYIYKYGNYHKYIKLYNEFFSLLEKEAKKIDNSIAIENLLEIKKFFNQEIITLYPDEIEENILFEGAKKQIVVNAYERSPKARKICIEEYGFNCFICGFNFQKTYGELGKEFIHVHHLKPLSEIQKEYKVNPIKDLRPVCPNCHAMLHRKIPAYSIEEIQNIIKGQ